MESIEEIENQLKEAKKQLEEATTQLEDVNARKARLGRLRHGPKFVPKFEPEQIHWDLFLSEAKWMANDFGRERKEKTDLFKKTAKSIMSHLNNISKNRSKKHEEDQIRLKKVSSTLSKMVERFWVLLDKVAVHKAKKQMEVEWKKDSEKQLDLLVEKASIIANHITLEEAASETPTSLKKQDPEDIKFPIVEKMEDEEEESLKKLEGNEDEGDEEDVDGEEDGEEEEEEEEEEQAPIYSIAQSRSRRGVTIKQADEIKEEPAANDAKDGDFEADEGEWSDDESTLEKEEKNAKPGDLKKQIQSELEEMKANEELSIDELLKKYYGDNLEEAFSMNMKQLDEDEDEKGEEESDDENEDAEEEGEHSAVKQRGRGRPRKAESTSATTLVKQEKKELSDVIVKKELPEEKTYGTKRPLKNAFNLPSDDLDDSSPTRKKQKLDEFLTEFLSTNLIKKQKPFATPFMIRASLRQYQYEGVKWLASLNVRNLNGILADEMGLGKTLQTISLLAHLAETYNIWGPHLIIVPTSLLMNWHAEFSKFLPSFEILIYNGTVKERQAKRAGWSKNFQFNVCLTTYTIALMDFALFKRKNWYYMILDEAHHIKNFKSLKWQTLLTFSSQRRLLLTGTPLQNNLMELWSLLHFLMPSIFDSHSDFKAWFADPLSSAIENSKVANEVNLLTKLHSLIRPFILRRLKKDVEKQLPSKIEFIVPCKLSKRQRMLYDEFIENRNTKNILEASDYRGLLNCLMQLRKVCNHPDLFAPRPIISPFTMVQPITYSYHTMFAQNCLRNGIGAYDPFFDSLDMKFKNLNYLWYNTATASAYDDYYGARRSRELNQIVPSFLFKLPFYQQVLASHATMEFLVEFVIRRVIDKKIEVIHLPSFCSGLDAASVLSSDQLYLVGYYCMKILRYYDPAFAIMPAGEEILQLYHGHSDAQKVIAHILLANQNENQTDPSFPQYSATVGANAEMDHPSWRMRYASFLDSSKMQLETQGGGRLLLGETVQHRYSLTPKTSCHKPIAGIKSHLISANMRGVSHQSLLTLNSALGTVELDILKCKLIACLKMQQLNLEKLHHVNDPCYGNDLRALLSKEFCTSHKKLRKSDVQSFDILKLLGLNAVSNKFTSEEYFSTFGPAIEAEIRPTPIQLIKRFQSYMEMLHWVPQRVVSTGLKIVVAGKGSGSQFNFVAREKALTIGPVLSLLDPFHKMNLRSNIMFPDKMTLQNDCGKLVVLDKLLKEKYRQGHRCLIFTQMSRVLDVLERFVNIHGWNYVRLDGSTKLELRQVIVDEFNNNNKIFLFLSSTRSGGVGLNLTGANTVVFYDSDWNPSIDKQAMDRCHRIGQMKDVYIYRLLSERTVEENIWRKQLQKRQLDDVVVDQGGFSASNEAVENKNDMSKDELFNVLTVIQDNTDIYRTRVLHEQSKDDDDEGMDAEFEEGGSQGRRRAKRVEVVSEYQAALRSVEHEDENEIENNPTPAPVEIMPRELSSVKVEPGAPSSSRFQAIQLDEKTEIQLTPLTEFGLKFIDECDPFGSLEKLKTTP